MRHMVLKTQKSINMIDFVVIFLLCYQLNGVDQLEHQ